MHCLIFDIGKTNKKAFVFDEAYQIVFEETTQLPETTDDDGDACEDVHALGAWVRRTAASILSDPRFRIRAVNCTTYGASFVHVDAAGHPVAPLYNYLKPFPADLQADFVAQYGDTDRLSLETASPLMGHLNSGLQLLWIKYRKPTVYAHIHQSLHLPQWVAKVLAEVAGGEAFTPCSEMTSLGCHTMLWDFQKHDYHRWVKAEEIDKKLAPIRVDATTSSSTPTAPHFGSGLHDSSAALIPYLRTFAEPFVLISTGTWCISLNPFNAEPLTAAELAQDCLCYLTFAGKPVKAARYFGGHEHEVAVSDMVTTYGVEGDFYKKESATPAYVGYAEFMRHMVDKQVASTRLALGSSNVQKIFVDGGFSHNAQYMQGLASAFPASEVYAAEVAQATALGAALHVHKFWNTQPVPAHLLTLRRVVA